MDSIFKSFNTQRDEFMDNKELNPMFSSIKNIFNNLGIADGFIFNLKH